MECKNCNSDRIIKNGVAKNKQRYYCKSCKVNFVEGDGRKGKNEEKKKLAIKLYLENMGFRAIGRVLGVSNVAVLKWVRAAGELVEAHHHQIQIVSQEQEPVEVIELDELWHYIDKKKETVGLDSL
jgi:transposase-like protein